MEWPHAGQTLGSVGSEAGCPICFLDFFIKQIDLSFTILVQVCTSTLPFISYYVTQTSL